MTIYEILSGLNWTLYIYISFRGKQDLSRSRALVCIFATFFSSLQQTLQSKETK